MSSLPGKWEALRQEFPHFYERIAIECGRGWYDILRELSLKIQEHLKVCPFYTEEGCEFSVVQVKEKYATLRYYCGNQCDHIDSYIDEAEEKSSKTCELCGDPGSLRGDFWLSTRCVKCFNHDQHLKSALFKPKFIDQNDPQG